jgi:hypothetical protein
VRELQEPLRHSTTVGEDDLLAAQARHAQDALAASRAADHVPKEASLLANHLVLPDGVLSDQEVCPSREPHPGFAPGAFHLHERVVVS